MIDIRHCDALDLLKSLPDESADLICIDPPYGITRLDYDKQAPDWSLLMPELKRVTTRKGACVIFGALRNFPDLLAFGKDWFRYEIIWTKTMTTGFLNANVRPLQAHEFMYIFSHSLAVSGAHDNTMTYNPQMKVGEAYISLSRGKTPHYSKNVSTKTVNLGDRHPTTIWHFENGHGGNSLHPNQKPLPLLLELINTFSNAGDTVLDCFLGSGTTALAAYVAGRNFIGCDINSDYVELARKRIANADPYQATDKGNGIIQRSLFE